LVYSPHGFGCHGAFAGMHLIGYLSMGLALRNLFKMK
jgi:hypothetical protein